MAGLPHSASLRNAVATGRSRLRPAWQRGMGSTLKDTSVTTPKATEAARQQPRQVVAGDVLHHLAAEAQVGAQATDQPRARTKSRTAPAQGRRGPDRPLASTPPTVRPAPKPAPRRRQHLPAAFQRTACKLVQRRTGAGGDHQFAGIVGDDPAVGERQRFAPRPACRGTPCYRRRRYAAGRAAPERRGPARAARHGMVGASVRSKYGWLIRNAQFRERRSTVGRTCMAPNSATMQN